MDKLIEVNPRIRYFVKGNIQLYHKWIMYRYWMYVKTGKSKYRGVIKMDKFDKYVHRIVDKLEEREQKMEMEKRKLLVHYNKETHNQLIDRALDERNEEEFYRLVEIRKEAERLGLG